MSNSKKLFRRCRAQMKDISSLACVGGLLAWDQETMMPPRASPARAEQSGVIAGVIHEKFIDPAMGAMLAELDAHADDLSSSEAAIVRERLRDYRKATTLPLDLVRDMARVASLAQDAWIKARAKSDFAMFAPWLEKTVALKRRQAKAYGYRGHPYDALLDDYEPYMTVAELDPVIDELTQGLVPIAHAITSSSANIDARLLHGHFPEAQQELMCRAIAARMGLDPQASRMDRSAHPFCAGISSPTDVRITIRFDEHEVTKAVSNVMHEGGHALYEQGLPERFVGTPLAESISLGIHESQSRLWENVIGLSLPFMTFLLPLLRTHFPGSFKKVSASQLYRALNRVGAKPIRIESDEVTYNLHIVLRYEIEKALLTGDLKVKELPHVWNDMMKKLLGIRPKDDAHGVLQDTHWASGLFGYFPTYSLGNLYAAQFWNTLTKDIPHIDAKMARGEFAPIRAWLGEHIHRHGRRYTALELIKRVTGTPLHAYHFLNYLKEKYGEIYKIRW